MDRCRGARSAQLTKKADDIGAARVILGDLIGEKQELDSRTIREFSKWLKARQQPGTIEVMLSLGEIKEWLKTWTDTPDAG